MGAHGIKRGLLFFWGLWLSLVTLTNVFDGLIALGVLAPSWAFASGNYEAVRRTTARYGTPGWLVGVLFLGVILWEGLAAGLFWRALLLFRSPPGRAGVSAANAAFAASAALWASFLLSAEVFIDYSTSAVHWRLFLATLASLLVVRLVQDSSSG